MNNLTPNEVVNRLMEDNPRIKTRNQLQVDVKRSNKARRDRLEAEKELREIFDGEYQLRGVDLTDGMSTRR